MLWCGQWNVRCSPLWTSPQSQRGESVFPRRCSHSFCGPLVRIQVYAEIAFLRHRGRLPLPKEACCRYPLRMSLPYALNPSCVAMLGAPAICPWWLWKFAAWSAISLPGMPMCDRTQEMPVSSSRRCASSLAIVSSIWDLGRAPFARFLIVLYYCR